MYFLCSYLLMFVGIDLVFCTCTHTVAFTNKALMWIGIATDAIVSVLGELNWEPFVLVKCSRELRFWIVNVL
jgi:hypothetical protein